MIYRCILPEWAESPTKPKVLEGEFSDEQIKKFNADGYNIYYLPNYPLEHTKGVPVDGSQIDVFEWVFCDMDLKEGKYADKDSFLTAIGESGIVPTKVVDSGNGMHAYWRVTDLDPMSFLKLQRRLLRRFDTDEAMAKIYQLLRVPGTLNTKDKNNFKACELLYEGERVYTCEELDKLLPSLSQDDLAYCQGHYDKTYKIVAPIEVDDKIPNKFNDLVRTVAEVRDLWANNQEDRSRSDYRLGHLMFAHGFTRDEAMSVLVNTSKASSRAPVHRVNYAANIVDKIWTFELEQDKTLLDLSRSVKDILQKSGEAIKGTRFACWRYLDATYSGFKLGQVIGLVAGSGVGKTAMALNMFMGFVQNNPDYEHFFVPLEQPAHEIADRWQTMCGEKTHLYEKVHVISNYADDGSFRHLSFDDIKDYLLKFQKVTGKKVGCVVIDHIGALKKKGKDGENQDLMDICHSMKAFAIATNTMLVMQSQAPREKAGIGDLELNKDAAYGTVYFESYCDYLITIWQPLKRCYNKENCPTVTAFKFCKIRHKKKHRDEIQEDVCYYLYFDAETEHMRELTQIEEQSFTYFINEATNLRKKDRKVDLVTYTKITWDTDSNGKSSINKNGSGSEGPRGLPQG